MKYVSILIGPVINLHKINLHVRKHLFLNNFKITSSSELKYLFHPKILSRTQKT